MAKRNLFLILLFTSVLTYSGHCQVSYGGSPASFRSLKSLKIDLPVVEMLPVSNYDLQLKDAQSKNQYKKFTFAKSFDVDISPDNSGIWEEMDGMKVWRVVVRSKGAYSLNLLFDRAILPTGASIFLYSTDHKILRGAFTANNEQTSGMLPIYPLPVDELVVEYNEPVAASAKGEIHISKVNHDYKNALGTRPLGEAGLCNMDVYCKDAAVMSKEKQAVVELIISGTDLCTGTLINNTKRDKTPYLITAGHCILTATNAQQTIFAFNYESPFCGQNGSANGYSDQTMSGAILRARSDSLDFALVELEMVPPPEYQPYYAGWDHSKTVPATTRAIHHPKGDVKKVSLDFDPPGISTYSSSGHVLNTFWLIKKWDVGTTEPGSSGGPLFSDANLVIGTLIGGSATCDNSIDDYFCMMAYQWNFSSLPTRQLKKWLDPLATGLLKLEALDPYLAPNVCNHFSDVIPDEKYVVNKVVNGRGYISGHNSMRINSYAQEFVQTSKTTLSAFSVAFAKASSGVYNSNSTVNFQIYKVNENTGLPGAILKSILMPIKSLKAQSMNFVVLDQPLDVTGRYFIGYDINYYNTTDSVAVYHAPARANIDSNRAYCNLNGSWQPFYWVPEINLKTSLLINSYGCATTYATVSTDSIQAGSRQFKVYYPSDPTYHLLYLINTGKEEFGRVIFYDMLGRKISETQRMLTAEPMQLNCGQLESAVYCITVETSSKKEVIKVKVLQSR